MMGTMNTRKQTGEARKKSIKELESGKWKKEFDETFTQYLKESDPEVKKSLFTILELKNLTYGIGNYPELKKHAEHRLRQIEFTKKWKDN